MRHRTLLPLAATLLLAACGGSSGETGGAGSSEAASDSAAVAPLPAGSVDTAGVGVGSTEPPTAGGQVVDTAAVPGAVDTLQGTPTAP